MDKGDTSQQGFLFWLPRQFFHRIVLDEAHTIKNHNTNVSKALTDLGNMVNKRWCLTGTPIQNTLKDLFSLCRFMQFAGCDTLHNFKSMVGSMNFKKINQPQKLNLFLKSCMLRRNKKQVFQN